MVDPESDHTEKTSQCWLWPYQHAVNIFKALNTGYKSEDSLSSNIKKNMPNCYDKVKNENVENWSVKKPGTVQSGRALRSFKIVLYSFLSSCWSAQYDKPTAIQ